MKMEKDKKYNIVLGVMIFLFIVVVGIVIAWGLRNVGVKTSGSTNDNTAGITNNDTSINSENVNVESTQNKDENVKEVIKEVAVSKMLEFDYTKSKNVDDNSNYKGAIAKTNYIVEKEMTLLIYSDGSAKISVILDDGPMEYPIENLKGKVRDGIIGSYYQGVNKGYVLLENGTVQGITGFDNFKQSGFIAEDVVTGVNNIVRLETIVNEGGKRLPVAIDKDGYYYSLQ